MSDDEKNPFDVDDDEGIDDWVGDAGGAGADIDVDVDDWVQTAERSTTGESPALRSMSTSEDHGSPSKAEESKKAAQPEDAAPDAPIPQPSEPASAAEPSPKVPQLAAQPAPQEPGATEPAAPVQVQAEKSSPASSADPDQQVPTQQHEVAKQATHPPEIEEVEDAGDKGQIGDTQQLQLQQQQDEQEAHSNAGGWGWGGGWGLGVIGGTLKAVAAGAVRDVKELTGSLQAALAEVDESSDDEHGAAAAGKPSTTSGHEEQAATKPTAAQPKPARTPPMAATASREANEGGRAPGDPPVPQEADRLLPSQETPDPELELGLKVIDEQVEQLASGAAKALSSLWGGLSGVAKKVEAATKTLAADLVASRGVGDDVAQLQAAATSGVRGVAANVTRIGTRLERGLETVGRTALGLIEEVTGQYNRGGMDGSTGSTGSGLRAASDPHQFEDFFYLYGGQQLCEELESLANECARTCNKARSRLEAPQQAELDATLAALGPLFSAALRGAGSGASVPAVAEGEQGVAHAREQLDHRYTPVSYLCQDSQVRAEAFQQMLLAALEQAATQALAAAAKASPQTSTPADMPAAGTPAAAGKDGSAGADGAAGAGEAAAGDAKGGEGEGHTAKDDTEGAAAPAAEGAQEGSAGEGEEEGEGWEVEVEGGEGEGEGQKEEGETRPVQSALAALQAHAAKRLAELATAQVQLLVDHGSSVAAPARSVRLMEDSVTWPAAPTQQAALLREQCTRMVSDLRTVAAAYCAAVSALLQALPADSPVPAASTDTPATSTATAATATSTTTAVPTAGAESDEAGAAPEAQTGEGAGEVAGASTEPVRTASGDAAVTGATATAAAVTEGAAQPEESERQVALALERELASAGDTAVSRVEEGFRGLLYAVLVRELVTRIAAAAPGSDDPEES